MRACLALTLSFCLFVLGTRAAKAAAWTLEQGQVQLFATSTFTYGDHSFDENGDLVEVPEYRKFNLTSALEYGVRPWLTALVRADITTVQDDAEIEALLDEELFAPPSRSFAAAGIGARLRLHRTSSRVFSVELNAFSGGFDSTGRRDFDEGPGIEGRALYGIGAELLGKPVFANIEGAYRAQFAADHSDEVRADLTAGVHLTPNWMVLAQSFSTIDVDGDAQSHKLAGSVVRSVTDSLRVQVGAFGTVYGERALRDLGGVFSIWYAPGSNRD